MKRIRPGKRSSREYQSASHQSFQNLNRNDSKAAYSNQYQRLFDGKRCNNIKMGQEDGALALSSSIFLASLFYLTYYSSFPIEEDLSKTWRNSIAFALFLSFFTNLYLIKKKMDKKSSATIKSNFNSSFLLEASSGTLQKSAAEPGSFEKKSTLVGITDNKQESFLFLKEDVSFNMHSCELKKLRLTLDTYCFGSILDNYRDGAVVCVDKTPLVKELVTRGKSRFVFLRPRRWGKSYNDHIIKEFFDMSGVKSLFEGSLISHDIQFCEKYQNAYFVAFFDFKDFHSSSYSECLASLSSMVKNIYEKIEESFSINMNDHQREKCTEYKNIFRQEDNYFIIQEKLVQSLKYMGTLIKVCSLKQVILIIDEYDTPIFSAYCAEDNLEEKEDLIQVEPPLYKKIAKLLRNVFSPFSKGGEAFNIKYVIITGILHITRETFLSGANAIEFSSLRSDLSHYFGFSEKEVNALLALFKLETIKDEVTAWYGGYFVGFGEQHQLLYNPYAIINFLSDNKNTRTNTQVAFRAYWKATSANDIHIKFLEKLKGYHSEYEKFISYFLKLLNNKPVQMTIKIHISFNELHACAQSADQLMNFFYLTGFLTHIPYHGLYNTEFSIEELIECHKVWIMIPNRDALNACQSVLKDHIPDYEFSPVFRRRSSIVRDYAEFSNIVVGRNQEEKEALKMVSFLFFSYDHLHSIRINPLSKSQKVSHLEDVEDERKDDETLFLLEEKQLYRLTLSHRDPVRSLSPRTIFLYKKKGEFYAKITHEPGIAEILCINRINDFDEDKIRRLPWLEGRDNSVIPDEDALDFIHWLAIKTNQKMKTTGWFLQARDALRRPVHCNLEEKKEFSKLFHYLTNTTQYDIRVIHDLVFSGLGYFSTSPHLIEAMLSAFQFTGLKTEFKNYIHRCAATYSDDLVRLHREHRLSYDADTFELATQSVLAIFPFNDDCSDTYNTSRSHFYYVDAYLQYVKTFDFSLSDALYTLFFRVIAYEIYMHFNMNHAQDHIHYLLTRMREGKAHCTYLESKEIALIYLNITALFYDYSDEIESELNILAKRVLREDELKILGLNRQSDLEAQRDYEYLQEKLPEKDHILYTTRILYRFGRFYYRKEHYRKAQACFDYVARYQEEIKEWLATFSLFISPHKPSIEEIRKQASDQVQAGKTKRVGYVYKEKGSLAYSLLDGKGHLEEEHDRVLIKQEADSELVVLLNRLLESTHEKEPRELNKLEHQKLVDLFLESHLQLTTNKHRYQFYKVITDISINENKSYALKCVSPEEEDQLILAPGIYLFKKEDSLKALVVHPQNEREKIIDLKKLPGASQYVKERKLDFSLKHKSSLDFFVEEEESFILSAFIKSACPDFYAKENRAKVSQLNKLVKKIRKRKYLNTLYSHVFLEVLQFQLQYAPETIQFEALNQARIATLSNYSTHHPEYAEWLYVISSYVLMGGPIPSTQVVGPKQFEIKEEERSRWLDVDASIKEMLEIYRLSFREGHPKGLLAKQLQAHFFHKKGHDNQALHLYTEIVDGYQREGIADNRIGRIYSSIADIHKYMGNRALAFINYNGFKETIKTREEMTRLLEAALPDFVSGGILSLNLAEIGIRENETGRGDFLNQLHRAHALFSAANVIRYIIAAHCQMASEYKMRMEYSRALKVLENIQHLVEATQALPAEIVLAYYRLHGSIHKLQNNLVQASTLYGKTKEVCDENQHTLSAIWIQDMVILRAGLAFIQNGDIPAYMIEIDKGLRVIEGTNNIYYIEKYTLKKCHLLIVNYGLDEAKKILDMLKGALHKDSITLSSFARVRLNYLMGRIHYHNKDYQAAKRSYEMATSDREIPYYQDKLECELAKITYVEESSDVFFLKPSMSQYVQASLFKILSLVKSAKDLEEAIIDGLPRVEEAYKGMLEKWSSELYQDFKPNWEPLQKSSPRNQLRYLFSMAINFIILRDLNRYKEMNDLMVGLLLKTSNEEQDDIIVSILISGFWLNVDPRDLYEKYIKVIDERGKKYFKYSSVNYGLACLSNVIGWKYENREKADSFFKRSTQYFEDSFKHEHNSCICARVEHARNLFLREKCKPPQERGHDELSELLDKVITATAQDRLSHLFFHTRMEMRCVMGGIKRLLEEYTCVLMDARGLAFYLKIKWLKHCEAEKKDIQDVMQQFSQYVSRNAILSNQYLLANARIILGQLNKSVIDYAIQPTYGQDYAIQKLHESYQKVVSGQENTSVLGTDPDSERIWEYFTRQFFEWQFVHHWFNLNTSRAETGWSVVVGDSVLCVYLKEIDEKHGKHLFDLLVDLKLRFSLLFDYLESDDREVKIINYKLYIQSDTRYIKMLRTIFLSINHHYDYIQWLFRSKDKIEDYLYEQGIKRLHSPTPNQKIEWKNPLDLYQLIIDQLRVIREGHANFDSLIQTVRASYALQPPPVLKLITELTDRVIDLKITITDTGQQLDEEYKPFAQAYSEAGRIRSPRASRKASPADDPVFESKQIGKEGQFQERHSETFLPAEIDPPEANTPLNSLRKAPLSPASLAKRKLGGISQRGYSLQRPASPFGMGLFGSVTSMSSSSSSSYSSSHFLEKQTTDTENDAKSKLNKEEQVVDNSALTKILKYRQRNASSASSVY